MRRAYFAVAIIGVLTAQADARCTNWPENFSSAYDRTAQRITMPPWRTDYPTTLVNQTQAWESVPFKPAQSVPNWRDYMKAVIDEVKASGVQITNKAITIGQNSPWFISLWMDEGRSGRESVLGLTKERSPDPGDLSPTSTEDHQVWALGFYNQEGAYGLGQIFADPCNPKVPAPVAGKPWRFPNRTASFKLLFTDAPASEVSYLADAPVVEAMIEPEGGGTTRVKRELRLLQMDIAVRDPRATKTEWVMGTYVWKGPATSGNFLDNMVPVGLMWGNDPGRQNGTWSKTASLRETRLNPDLAGVVWQGPNGGWPQRPYPGFQGRLNGPADNLRSSCLSCHGLGQWPRGLAVPSWKIDQPPNSQKITEIRRDYFKNIKGGSLATPGPNLVAVDYSLQVQFGFVHLCNACKAGQINGPTPDVCKPQITRPQCTLPTPMMAVPHVQAPPRQ